MSNPIIKVGFLIAYDWHLLKNSLPLVYDHSDTIVLALDINRRSWAGQPFKFDEVLFNEFIATIDTQRKIILFQDDFYEPSLTTMQNEVRERKMLAEKMGSGGWHIQLDCDEYAIDFQEFVSLLKRIDPNPDPSKIRKPVNVTGNCISVVKTVKGGFIIVKPEKNNRELVMLATQVPDYWSGRKNGHFNIQTSLIIIHETRSRTEEEFYFKLKNWGHNQDFDTEKDYARWKSIDASNYKTIKNLHPTEQSMWRELLFVEARSIDDLIERFKHDKSVRPSRFSLFVGNSRNIARMKALLERLWRR